MVERAGIQQLMSLQRQEIGGFTITGRWREIGTGGQEVDLTGRWREIGNVGQEVGITGWWMEIGTGGQDVIILRTNATMASPKTITMVGRGMVG